MQRTLEPEVMDTSEEADAYAAMDHGAVNRAFVERLLELGASGRMLDVGAGPGDIPVRVCRCIPGAQVVALDASACMLEHARRLREAARLTDRVALRRGDAGKLPFPDACFDAVFSNTMLHHLPDPLPFLREARRVLRSGGALLIRDLFRPENPERVEELVALHAAQATPAQRELFRASLHAALRPDELRTLADRAGLGDAAVLLDSDRHVSLQLAARSL